MIVDQATKLRELARRMSSTSRVVAVTSGKGGVGKTNIALNLAIMCARRNKRVMVMDVDLGLANVDLILDLNARFNLSHVIAGKKRINEVVVNGPGGLLIVPGASGIAQLADLSDEDRGRLVEDLRSLERQADLIFVDTAAGIGKNTINFASAADEVMVVTTPEPTAITDAYATIKTIVRTRSHGRLGVVVNMARSKQEAARVADRIASVARQFLGIEVDRLGYVLADENVATAVRRRRPFALEFPRTPATYCVDALSAHYVGPTRVRRRATSGFFARLLNLFGSSATGRA